MTDKTRNSGGSGRGSGTTESVAALQFAEQLIALIDAARYSWAVAQRVPCSRVLAATDPGQT